MLGVRRNLGAQPFPQLVRDRRPHRRRYQFHLFRIAGPHQGQVHQVLPGAEPHRRRSQIAQLLGDRAPDYSGTVGGEPNPAARRVYVTGAVVDPAVYDVRSGDRIEDLLNLAGGPTAEADLSRLNLAAFLADGQQVHVPAVGEVVAASAAIDINLAGAEELEDLPGIGPVTAEKIVNHRTVNGPIGSPDDLLAAGLTRTQVEALEGLILYR